jgi:3-oxoacyl-[acyl-carrier protein] reductase
VAVVTGAGRGIGRAIALALAARGLDIAMLGRKVTDLLTGVTLITKTHPAVRVLSIGCDVARSDEVTKAAAFVHAELGPARVVVNNAGVVHRATVEETSEEDWSHVVDVNLKGTFLVTRAFLPAMKAAARGRIVHIASISATLGTPRLSAYCASKWGVVGFMKSLGEELRGTGLQTMAVLPASVDTDMLQGSEFAAQMTADDVARAVVYAALDAPDAMNGATIELFGA